MEILALHEASRECVWLQCIMHYIQITSNLASVIDIPTIIYENNIAYLAQIRGGYNKRDRTKYISPKFFLYSWGTTEQKNYVKQLCSTNTFTNLFVKSLLTSAFEKLVQNIGMHRLNKLSNLYMTFENIFHQGEHILKIRVYVAMLEKYALYSFFFYYVLFH